MTQPTDATPPYSQFSRRKKTLRPLTFSSALLKLWDQAADNLTLEELHWFSDFDFVDMATMDLHDVIEGIACLVVNDQRENNHLITGYFQSPEAISILLFTIANSVDALRGLGFVANDAKHRLATRGSTPEHQIFP
jgi:hypothetical protein